MSHHRFEVQSAADFINSGPAFGSREEKLAIQTEESAKRDHEQRRRKRLDRMTSKDIERERRIFEWCDCVSQLKSRLDKEEGLPSWLK